MASALENYQLWKTISSGKLSALENYQLWKTISSKKQRATIKKPRAKKTLSAGLISTKGFTGA